MRERRKLIIYLDGEEEYVNAALDGLKIEGECQVADAEADGVTLKINMVEEGPIEVLKRKAPESSRQIRARRGGKK